MAAAYTHEGPHFGGFLRPALQHAAAVALDGLVVERKPHCDGGVVGVALAPRLGQVALQQLDVGDPIDDVLARIRRQLLREIGEHLGRNVPAQPREIFGAIRALHLVKGLLQGIEVIVRAPGCPGCVMLRSIGRAPGDVVVDGGAEKVCEPRLPKLPPRPARASASVIAKANTAATAQSASSGRTRKESMEILPDRPFGPPKYWYPRAAL